MTDPTSEPDASVPQERKLSPWRIVVIITGVAIMAVVAFQSLNEGASTASLEIGDCFELPDSGEFTKVTPQDCSGRHEAQIYAAISSASGTAEEQCRKELEPLLDGYDLPADGGLAEIAVAGEAFSSLCLLTSDSSALVGSLLP